MIGYTLINGTGHFTWPKPAMAEMKKNDVPEEAPAEVKAAIEALRSPFPGQRRDAADALGRMGKKAVPAIPVLIELLSDDSFTLVGDLVKVTPGDAAAEALTRIGEPAIGPVVNALSSPNPTVRRQVTYILREFCEEFKDQRVKDALIIALQDKDPKVKEKASFAIRDCQDPRAVEHLVRHLKDDDRSVRIAAACALRQSRDIRALPSLIESLQDKDEEVRRRVVDALAVLKDPRAVEAILNTIRTDPCKKVRERAENRLRGMRGPYAIELLLSALKDSSAAVRKAAVSSLKRQRETTDSIKRRVAEAILSALKDEDPRVREEAAKSASLAMAMLAYTPSTDFTEKPHESTSKESQHLAILTAALKDSVVKVRVEAVRALSKTYRRTRNPLILDALTPMTRDKAPEVRSALAMLVWDERTAEILEPLLRDSHPKVRRKAVRSMISESSSVDTLIQALKDDDVSVRIMAAKSLGKIGDTKAVEPLMDLIRSKRGYEGASFDSFPVEKIVRPREEAIKALGHLRDPRAAGLLLGILQNDEEALKVRCLAAHALRGMKDDKQVFDALLHELKNGGTILRRNVAEVLGTYPRQERAVKYLIEALSDEDTYVRSRAAVSLGGFEDPSVVEPLIEALDDQEALVRKEAADSLKNFKDPRALEALIPLLDDEQEEVSDTAQRALQKITRLSLGGESRKWQSWWRKNKDAFLEFNEMEKKLARQPTGEHLEAIKACLNDSNTYIVFQYVLKYDH
ncbi:MAG: HEAT repeat domain-containing protein [Desulfobia sp.]